MKRLNKEVGFLGEEIAVKYLKKYGYVILERNFNCKIGEIDIIGKDKDYIVFIEVKTRYSNIYGSPGEAVTHSKQYKIYKIAQYYIMNKKFYKFNFRFDVIEIMLNNKNNKYSIKLIKNAFQI
ncbi:putative endonuclease [Clostridium sp. USBA 49]|uniref:YraN family protein n=1 Tax=Clostridium TaxID=1485 RepID=UPI00099951F8|nr:MULTISPECIES: YraN family protein [Clostridium]SKA76409.1 putative endonuclease [Clostridium sp. USBA 49]